LQPDTSHAKAEDQSSSWLLYFLVTREKGEMGFVMNLTSFGELGDNHCQEESRTKSACRKTGVFRKIGFGARFYPMRPVVDLLLKKGN
jgi:hypothetical protein